MDIKLRARLSAYSKVESTEQPVNRVTEAEIDTLFDSSLTDKLVTKDDIDALFEEQPEATNPEIVSFAEIDSLFR